MTPLQSPEYAALIAAKEASGKAYAALDRASDKLALAVRAIADATNETQEAVNSAILDAASEVCFIRVACVDVYDADVTIRQAAFDAAYPAPINVVDAVEAVKQLAIIHAVSVDNFDASLTPTQQEAQTVISESKAALDAAVTAAKALIEAAQVSPSKAFVVRKSVKTAVSVEADRPYIFEAARGGVLPVSLLTLDESALVKWIEDNPDAALDYGASVARTENTAVSVAFYVAKL